MSFYGGRDLHTASACSLFLLSAARAGGNGGDCCGTEPAGTDASGSEVVDNKGSARDAPHELMARYGVACGGTQPTGTGADGRCLQGVPAGDAASRRAGRQGREDVRWLTEDGRRWKSVALDSTEMRRRSRRREERWVREDSGGDGNSRRCMEQTRPERNEA